MLCCATALRESVIARKKYLGENIMLKNKKLSILGDSISTYQGVSNNAEANTTIAVNPYFYRSPFPEEKTYWSLVCKEFGLELCVNNSWSGGNLSGKEDLTAGVNRAEFLDHTDGSTPDLVILFMGMNDLGRGFPADVFGKDYKATIATIRKEYPNAKICCVNMPNRASYVSARTVEFNNAILNATESFGSHCFIADLFNSKLNNDGYYMNTLDGLHPDEDGMRIIAEVVIKAIKENM